MGSSEKQRAHHRLLHTADPGGSQIPARQPDSTQRHQGEQTEDTVQIMFQSTGSLTGRHHGQC